MCLWVARSRPCSVLQPQRDATIEDLRQRLPTLDETRGDRGFRAQLEALSDLLLASFFATAGFPAHLDRLQDVYRVYHVPAADDQGLLEPLTQALARPLLAPGLRGVTSHRRPRQPATSRPHSPSVTALAEAIHELAQPGSPGTARSTRRRRIRTAAAARRSP